MNIPTDGTITKWIYQQMDLPTIGTTTDGPNSQLTGVGYGEVYTSTNIEP